MTLLHASKVFLPLLLSFLPGVDPGEDGKTLGPNRGRGSGKGQIVRVECLDGAFEEPFLHDISTFGNPPKSGFYNAVHMSLIPKGPHRGKILTFDIDPTHFEDEGTERGTWVQRWSIVHPPTLGTLEAPAFFNGELELTPCGGDIFCSGHAWDAEGRLFVAGGTTGWGQYEEETRLQGEDPNSSLGGDNKGFFKGRPCHPKFPDVIGANLALSWDPDMGPTGEWIFHKSLQQARYYPTVRLLPDGRMMVIGGGPTPDFLTYWNDYEVFDPVTGNWEFNGVDHVFAGPAYPDGRDPIQLYPRVHILTTGELFLSSMTGWSAKLDHAAAPGVWEIMGHTGFDYRVYGTALALPEIYEGPDRILIAGGDAFLGTTPQTIQGFGSLATVQFAHAAAPVAPQWDWQDMESNHRPRTYPMMVVLPDATLVMTGGQTFPGAALFVGSTELYSPQTRAWREVGEPYPFLKHGGDEEEHLNARAYHQGALLLPDGRVFIGGGNQRTSDYVIYQPPYLTCGQPRPVITAHPAEATWTEPVTVEFEEMPPSHTVTRAVLMAPGSATHHADYSASHVELEIVASSSDHVDVSMPLSPNHAPPGYYMLFLISSVDVPSEAGWIKLR